MHYIHWTIKGKKYKLGNATQTVDRHAPRGRKGESIPEIKIAGLLQTCTAVVGNMLIVC